MNKLLLLILAFLSILACKEENIDGIVIGDTLFVHQTIKENREIKKLIKEALNRDSKAIVNLTNSNCGGGAGCYDLGYIITQIVYRLGEESFIKIVADISTEEKEQLEWLILAGLEYGDNNYDSKKDNKRLKNEFPNLYMLLR